MKIIKHVSIVVVVLVIISNIQIVASSVQEAISVVINTIAIDLNGQSVGEKDKNYTLSTGEDVPLSMIYNGTTYLPIRKISELLGLDVGWNGETRTISLTSSSTIPRTDSQVTTIDEMRYDNAVFQLTGNNVQTVSLFHSNKYHDADYKITDGELVLTNKLPINASTTVSIVSSDSTSTYQIKNTTLPTLDDATQSPYEDMKYVLLPAMPKKGFNFPMLVCVGNRRGFQQSPSKKHLFVDTLNIGGFNTIEAFENLDINEAIGGAGFGHMFALQLDMPFLLPLIPRTGVSFHTDTTGHASIYESALDRDAIFYEEILSGDMYGPSVAEDVRTQLIEKGFNPNDFINIDEQVIHMISYANEYLEDHGYVLEDKVFMNGFSASGTFVDRFATLHPEVVRAYCGGAAGDDFVLPAQQVDGYELMLPLGVSDYTIATGENFDLDAYNNVARIIHMGRDDTNDVFKYSSCYGEDEMSIADALWGDTPLQRAYDLFDDFAQTGGKGLLVLDKGIQHGSSPEMNDYILEFYQSNIGDDSPVVYPDIDSSNLEFQLFQ